MNHELISKIEATHLRKDLPNFKVGDSVDVGTVIRDGDKQRIQRFKGVVISIKGSGTRKTFIVRKISYGIGVEKTFPLYSPNISDIVIVKPGKARRAKLYYLRNRVGKLALKVKVGKELPQLEYIEETAAEPELASDAEAEQPTSAIEEVVVESEATSPAAEVVA